MIVLLRQSVNHRLGATRGLIGEEETGRALTRTPTSEKCTASHCVKLLTIFAAL
jgi:hypothetical protein